MDDNGGNVFCCKRTGVPKRVGGGSSFLYLLGRRRRLGGAALPGGVGVGVASAKKK